MSFSSFYSSAAGEDSGSGRRTTPELHLDGYDCESEEGAEAAEEPVKPAPARPSGTKRSRAAEVHNLSEKRRRSRINEKMKALQNLIPNSNKTDKASMLDEAIEYLKKLQLQVQMLSMRNGISLHPIYLPSTLQPMQASQLHMGFTADCGPTMNMEIGMLPLNPDSAQQNSFDILNQSTHSNQSIIIPATNVGDLECSFQMGSSHSHQGSFHIPVNTEFNTEEMRTQQQLNPGHSTRNHPENQRKSIDVTTSLHASKQASFVERTEPLETNIVVRESSQGMLSNDPHHQIFTRQFSGLQTDQSISEDDMKREDSSSGF